jgi:adenylate kinase family enzyme
VSEQTAQLPDLGRRIVILGPSCSGKSTLAEQLAQVLDAPFIELDALFWKPGWVEPDAEDFKAKLLAAHAGDSWVTAGNYFRHMRGTVWPRTETFIWLDFPLHLTARRVISRSWRRWRSKELLWGTNTERFWDQLMVWSQKRSLVGYNIRSRRRQRRTVTDLMHEPAFASCRFITLKSPRELSALLEQVRTATGAE